MKPGGEVSDIGFEYKDVEKTRIDNESNLIVDTEFGEIKHAKPVCYQVIEGERVKIKAEFKKIENNTFGFEVEEYNKKFGDAVYIDCSLYQTANAILREILLSLGSVVASKSNYDHVKRLKKKAEKLKLAVILDHFENLRTHEILKILLGLNVPFCLVSVSFVSYRKMSLALRSRITNVLKISPFTEEETLEIL